MIGTEQRPLRVAIVGAGPSGFFAADALLTTPDLVAHVDMFERLPSPFGMARSGVAPDHQSIKAVTRVFDRCAERPGFRLFCNIAFGKDVQLADLREHYDQVIFATGNSLSRSMDVPGEELSGCFGAADFVSWYNGHPDYANVPVDLRAVQSVAVIGNGNVAVDVARLLARQPKDLDSSDMPDYALEAFRQSSVRDVYLIGRRGPVQGAFSSAEVRELGELANVAPVVDAREIALDAESAADLAAEGEGSTAAKNVASLREYSARGVGRELRRLHFCFLRSPVEVCGQGGRVSAIRLRHNVLLRDAQGGLRPRGTETIETLPVEMVIPAVGYCAEPLPGVPFDEKRLLIANREGRVIDPKTGNAFGQLYVVGWAENGPRGLIGSNKPAARAVVAKMIEQGRDSALESRPLPHASAMPALLQDRGARAISFADWKKLDALEISRGKARGAVRLKFTRVDDALRALE